MVDPQEVVDIARECLGTPFVHQGRICGKAMDCAGLPIHICKRKGLPFNDMQGYPRRPYKGMLEASLSEQPSFQKVPLTDLQAGDLVLFKISTAPQHLGIFTGSTIIHAYQPSGRVVEQPFAPWKNQLRHVYRFSQ